MIYQDSVQAYFRSASHVGMRQHLSRRGVFDLPGGIALWRSVGKILLVLLPLVLTAQFILSSMVSSAERAVRVADDTQYNFTITNSLLKAERSRLVTPDQVRAIAGESFALHTPEKGQVRVYNRTTGQFTYL